MHVLSRNTLEVPFSHVAPLDFLHLTSGDDLEEATLPPAGSELVACVLAQDIAVDCGGSSRSSSKGRSSRGIARASSRTGRCWRSSSRQE